MTDSEDRLQQHIAQMEQEYRKDFWKIGAFFFAFGVGMTLLLQPVLDQLFR